jgi:phosphohistidine phosphatase SixA
MKLTIHTDDGQTKEVEAFPTESPEIAIHEIALRDSENHEVGKVWNISHIPTGKALLANLLTKDLAQSAVSMLIMSGIKFEGQTKIPFLIDAFQGAANLMTDAYFSAVTNGKGAFANA